MFTFIIRCAIIIRIEITIVKLCYIDRSLSIHTHNIPSYFYIYNDGIKIYIYLIFLLLNPLN